MSLNQAKPTIINDSFHKKAMKWQSRLKDELAVNRIAKKNQKLDECRLVEHANDANDTHLPPSWGV